VAENPRIEELRRRVLADPASIAFAALAEEFRRVGALADAIETCRTGLLRHPAYLSARVTLGRALIETGDYEGAREELETVLRSAPENLAAIRGLEQINERLGHSTEMDPHLAELMREEAVRVANAPPPPPKPEPIVETRPPEPEPVPLSEPEPELTMAPPDPEPVFAIPLEVVSEPEPEPEPEPAMHAEHVVEIDLDLEPEMARQPSPGPDPQMLATLARLERFLAAVETARHA
jgi:tetratricopeptide (TPR) repeat protein